MAEAADTVSGAPDTVNEVLDTLLRPSSKVESRSSCLKNEAEARFIACGHKPQGLHAHSRDGSNVGIGRLFVAKRATLHLCERTGC